MAAKKAQRKSSRYRDIATELQKQIRLGATPVGQLLPTETELMARFSASRQTVREALRIITEQASQRRNVLAGIGGIYRERAGELQRHPVVVLDGGTRSVADHLGRPSHVQRKEAEGTAE